MDPQHCWDLLAFMLINLIDVALNFKKLKGGQRSARTLTNFERGIRCKNDTGMPGAMSGSGDLRRPDDLLMSHEC